MSTRQGVTVAEEKMMQKMVKEGAEWPEVAAKLTDVDLDYVKKNLFDPMVETADGLAPPKPAPAAK